MTIELNSLTSKLNAFIKNHTVLVQTPVGLVPVVPVEDNLTQELRDMLLAATEIVDTEFEELNTVIKVDDAVAANDEEKT